MSGESAQPTGHGKESAPADGSADILYIMGTGRSGTTILEILLAGNPGMVGVGEVTHIFQHGFAENRTCACGRPFAACEFWSKVRTASGWDARSAAEAGSVLRALEGHSKFAALALGLTSAKQIREYSAINARLFSAIGEAARPAVVIDSSKYAGRALQLARLWRVRVRILCVTRSPEGLIQAFKKPHELEQRPKSLLAAAAYYLYVVTCLRVVRTLCGDRVLTVNYEQLAQDPLGTLTRIEGWSGYDLSQSKKRISSGASFPVGHIVTGNRIRTQGSVRFQPRAQAGESESGALEKFVVAGLRRYGRLLGF